MTLARPASATVLLFLFLAGCAPLTFSQESTLDSASQVRVTSYYRTLGVNGEQTRLLSATDVPKVVRLLRAGYSREEEGAAETYRLEFLSSTGAVVGVVHVFGYEWRLESSHWGNVAATSELISYLDSLFPPPKPENPDYSIPVPN